MAYGIALYEQAVRDTPRRSGEGILDWLARINEAVGETNELPSLVPAREARLPYRDPGEEG